VLRPLRLPVAVRNPVSLIGIVIATAMAMLFLALVVLEMLGYVTNPYIGLLVFVAIPTVFVIGLLFIPVGAWWTRRRSRIAPGPEPDWPVLDLRNPHQRTVFVLVIALTIVNLLMSMAAMAAFITWNPPSSAAGVCHTAMNRNAWPTRSGLTRGWRAPSAMSVRVPVRWWSRARGHRQLFQWAPAGRDADSLAGRVTFWARETCEQCHWPENSMVTNSDYPRVCR
jgi:hypothetical protein